MHINHRRRNYHRSYCCWKSSKEVRRSLWKIIRLKYKEELRDHPEEASTVFDMKVFNKLWLWY